jgi:phosphoglycerate kinase
MSSDAPRRLRRLQDADLDGKVVLVRVDHNCVRRGALTDAFRVDATVATLYNIVERGGRPVLMTHVGRPYDKKTKTITVDDDDAATCVARYLQARLGVTFAVPEFRSDAKRGIVDIDTSVNWLIDDLKARRIGGVYLPNARWFAGEEGHFGEDLSQRFAAQLAGVADVFVNDAFGSWQPHVSTFGVTKLLPSYAGLLMQKEIKALDALLHPTRPFLAVIAGAKLDTKIGTVKAIAERCDSLMLGGQLYNAYLAAKFGITIAGVSSEDVELARVSLLGDTEIERKLLPLSTLVESADLSGCGCVPRDGVCGDVSTNDAGKKTTNPVNVRDLVAGKTYGYFLDVAPVSFAEARVKAALRGAKTIFVNAVMGLTSSGFHEGHGGARRRHRGKRGGAQVFRRRRHARGVQVVVSRSVHERVGGPAVLPVHRGGDGVESVGDGRRARFTNRGRADGGTRGERFRRRKARRAQVRATCDVRLRAARTRNYTRVEIMVERKKSVVQLRVP